MQSEDLTHVAEVDQAARLQQARDAVPESVYYARHLRLPGFTQETQARLLRARVLIVGVGGLGCPISLYLAGAGVGHIALLDGDVVSATNLHRQVLFDASVIGEMKAVAAAKRLSMTNPHIQIEPIPEFGSAALLMDLVKRFDVVVDGTDNFDAKYAIADACEAHGVPLVHGSIFQFEGQVSVFHHRTAECPDGMSYRHLYPAPPPSSLAQNCGEAGVIGVLPGIVGTMQANETIKVITGLGQTLSGFLWSFDALSGTTRRLKLKAAPVSKAKSDPIANPDIPEMDIEEMRASLDQQPPGPENAKFRLHVVDVREAHERAAESLGGVHIPLGLLPDAWRSLPIDQDILVYCKSGVRSSKAVLYLRSVMPNARIFSLKGGVDGAGCRLPTMT